MQKQRPPTLSHPVGYSFLVGFAIFIFGTCVYVLTHTHKVVNLRDLTDNLITAIVTGLIVLIYERRRHQDMRHRLRIIAAMNHHIRNALQSILWVPYTADQAEQLKRVHNSVNRIEWALREILPGESSDAPDAQFPGQVTGNPRQAGTGRPKNPAEGTGDR
jgi:hypothetical protein